jgi:hypothetical protein
MKLASRGNRCRTFLHYHPEILDKLLVVQAETGKPFRARHDRNGKALSLTFAHPYAMYLAAHTFSKSLDEATNRQGFFSRLFDNAPAANAVIEVLA